MSWAIEIYRKAWKPLLRSSTSSPSEQTQWTPQIQEWVLLFLSWRPAHIIAGNNWQCLRKFLYPRSLTDLHGRTSSQWTFSWLVWLWFISQLPAIEFDWDSDGNTWRHRPFRREDISPDHSTYPISVIPMSPSGHARWLKNTRKDRDMSKGIDIHTWTQVEAKILWLWASSVCQQRAEGSWIYFMRGQWVNGVRELQASPLVDVQ